MGRFTVGGLAGFLVMFFGSTAFAQWSYYGGAYSAYDSNPLGLNETDASQIAMLEAGVGRIGKAFDFNYSGTYTAYTQLSSFDHYWHQAYFSFGSDTTTVYLQAEQRLPVRDNTYGYGKIGVYASHQFSVAGITTTIQGIGQYYRFAVLSERNQGSLLVSLRARRSFQTGTTFIADVGTGYTVYPNLDQTLPLQRSSNTPGVVQINWGLRFAQSLTPTTGVAVQYRQQVLDQSSLAPYTEQNFTSYAIVDDPSIYESRMLGLELTQMFFNYQLMLKAGAYGMRRDFVAQGSFLDPEQYRVETPREDSYATVFLNGAWEIRPQWLKGHKIELHFSAQWTHNESNSYWYRYHNQAIALGVGYEY